MFIFSQSQSFMKTLLLKMAAIIL